MAAGQGFKTFATGDVLSASDVNGYLMQGVLVFADATERNAEITSPQEGQFAYLKDTNVTTYYTGSAWANLDTTGMTNPMTTTGDTIYSSSGSTPARLGIGSTGQVLTVSGGVPSWATMAASGMTLVSRQSFTNVPNTTTTFDGVFTSTYKTYLLVVETISAATATDDLLMFYRYSGTTQAAGYYDCAMKATAGTNTWTNFGAGGGTSAFTLTDACGASGTPTNGHLFIAMAGQGSSRVQHRGQFVTGNQPNFTFNGGYADTARAYDGVVFASTGSNITGTVAIYGLAAA
jgi:hypothetical protein